MAKKTTVITSESKMDEIFGQDEIQKGILPSYPTPAVGGSAKTFTIQPIIDAEGNPRLLETVDFDNGPGDFMHVTDVINGKDNYEIIYQLNAGGSIKRSLNVIRNDPANGFKSYNDLIGKTFSMIATAFSGKDKNYTCRECNGKGCVECGGTGKGKVFSLTLRRDLMSPTKVARGNIENKF